MPSRLTSFIGREDEIAEVARLLSDSRLVTLTGEGGCGKTRLALEIAARQLGAYPDGVCFVDLTTQGQPERIAQTLASHLELNELPDEDHVGALALQLRSLCLLLVLDNCEHLVDACAGIVGALLESCPGLHILSTSRQPLGIRREAVCRVSALSVPDTTELPSFEQLLNYEAVQLFIERARSKHRDFRITPENAATIARIVYHLDGSPLAIELAAARTHVLAVEQIEERLDNRFDLLTTSDHTVHPRHGNLRALLDWSYNLLPQAEQALLCALSVFKGSFNLAAVRALCEGESYARDTALLLRSLVHKSLVLEVEHPTETRYRFTETTRHYAEQKLVEDDRRQTTDDSTSKIQNPKSKIATSVVNLRDRHLRWYLQLAQETSPPMDAPPDEQGLARLSVEHDNLRAALEWARESGNVEAFLHLVSNLEWFWIVRGHINEGWTWVESALALPIRPELLAARARVLKAAGMLARFRGDMPTAQRVMRESLDAWRAVDDKPGMVVALIGLGFLSRYKGDLAQSQAYFDESLALARESGDRHSIAQALHGLGHLALRQGNYTLAANRLRESLAHLKLLRDKFGVATCTRSLGFVSLCQGKYKWATTLLEKSLLAFVELDMLLRIAESLELLAEVACAQHAYERAATLFGAADALFNASGSPPMPMDPAENARSIATTRAALGDDAWARAWEAGQNMAQQEAVDFVLSDRSRKPQFEDIIQPVALPIDLAAPLPDPPYAAGLTRRQVEVLRLVAAGLSDAQVAAHLALSRRTVEAHLRDIYARQGVADRAALVKYATENHLFGGMSPSAPSELPTRPDG